MLPAQGHTVPSGVQLEKTGSARRQVFEPVPTYASLLARVRETLLLGRQAIEKAKVETYWKTGRYIHEHILQYKDRADYGTRLIQRLAGDLEVSDRLLYQTRQFYQAYPISHRGAKSLPEDLSWSHYRKLAVIPDEDLRLDLTEKARKKHWSAVELSERIRLEVRESAAAHQKGPSPNGKMTAVPQLAAKLGTLYAYRLTGNTDAAQGDALLRIDLGFETRHWLSRTELSRCSDGSVLRHKSKALTREDSKGLKDGDIIESVRDEAGEYSFRKSKLTKDQLYTYKAQVERVVDGDTIIVLIDLGFKVEERHYLRLRGIDCPELVTEEGKRAKRFVEKQLAKVSEVILTSTRSDKYGRYLADVWLPAKAVILSNAKDLVFLNQLLLNEKLAVKMG